MQRYLSPNDWSRCYVVHHDNVASNIPLWGSLGEPGAYDHARGILVEISRALTATPIFLYYHELQTRDRHPVGTLIIATVREPTGNRVAVIEQRETAPYGRRGDYWQVTINGTIPEQGIAAYPPSPPWLANLVWRTVHPAQ